jgi:hypothetical protein
MMGRLRICTYLAFAHSLFSTVSADTLEFGNATWHVVGDSARVEAFGGRTGVLRLDNSSVFLTNVSLRDVVIEFDINHPDDRAFLGVIFRAEDFLNFEEFYIRPHRSDVPDSFQYTPVFNGSYGWQLYAGAGFSGALRHRYGEWRHVKLIVKGNRAAVFVDDRRKPALYMHDLKREAASGFVGLRVLSYTSAAHFSNFVVSSGETVELPPAERVDEVACRTCIRRWEISPALPSGIGIDELPEEGWDEVMTEWDGLLNIARYRRHSADDSDTVFAAATIVSETGQYQALDFGFSDAAVVYLNGVPISGGDDTYASRDYRFLGTIGIFDRAYLPLQAGENRLVIAVREAFGGWGLKAKIEPAPDAP